MASSSAKPMSVEKIASALQSIPTKKENLRKAFEIVQSQSSHPASFNVQWSDLDSHFSTLQSSLDSSFKLLQSKIPEKPPSPEPYVRPELKSFCVESDGIGLRSFIMDRKKEVPTTLEEVTAALRFAPNPAKMVLESLKGFFPMKGKSRKAGGDSELGAVRRTCVLLLEALAEIGVEIEAELKEEAKKLALEWKKKVSTESEDQLEALVFLQLLGTFGLADEFSVEELLDLLVSVSKRRQAVDLCKGLGFHSKVPDLIKKLNSKGKQIVSVKFAYAFGLEDTFPPVPLFDAYVKESKKVAKEVIEKGNNSLQSQNEAIAKEISYLTAIINCIVDYKLESEYPRASLDKRIKELQKQKPAKRSQQPRYGANQQQSENKRPRVDIADMTTSGFAPGPLNPLQHSYTSEHLSPYLSSSTYGLLGTNPALDPYRSAIASSSVLGSDRLDIGAKTDTSFSRMPSGMYDLPKGYGGHGLLPSYQSSFY